MINNVELLETTLEEQEGLKLSSFKLKSSYPYNPPVSTAKTAVRGGH